MGRRRSAVEVGVQNPVNLLDPWARERLDHVATAAIDQDRPLAALDQIDFRTAA
jgi:hypothetical protein